MAGKMYICFGDNVNDFINLVEFFQFKNNEFEVSLLT